MTAPWIERHGGLWLNRAATANRLLVEEFNAEHDAFTLIWQRASDGNFQAEYLVKGKAHTDPQWSLPFWGNIAGQSIFGTVEDARVHVLAISSEYRRKLAGA